MEHYENIEKYGRGELSPKEKTDFENQLATDEKLVKELVAYRKNELAIKSSARQQLRASAESAYAKINKKTRSVMVRRLAIAAGFLLLMAAGLWWAGNGANKNNTEKIFATYFEMPPPPTLRSENTADQSDWQTAIDLYSKNEFNKVAPLFEKLLSENDFKQKETAKILLAASFIHENKYESALSVLNQISPESTYKQDAEWYRGLALLKLKKTAEAISVFENIAQQKRHYKKKEAQEILRNLK